jgi:N-methylhydantoinase B
MKLEPGDCVRVFTAGGGGYGDPKLRERRRVLADVLDGYISAASAAADYDVDVDDFHGEATI